VFLIRRDNEGYSYSYTQKEPCYLEHVCSVFVVIMQDIATVLHSRNLLICKSVFRACRDNAGHSYSSTQ
jgi:hypothetical protein